ncbi:hypothetical protein BH10PLA2_BH10PLA2_31430 [soil metagenome]
MEMGTSWTQLTNSFTVLRANWDNLKDDWRDQAQEDFETRYWNPMEAQVKAVLRAMDRLAPHLAKAREECS